MPKIKGKTEHFTEEEILKSEPKFIDIYTNSKPKTGAMRLLFRFFKGYYLKLFFACILYGIKSCPYWIMPLITADVIDIATTKPANAEQRLLIDLAAALVLLVQNVPLHMLYSKLFRTSLRSVEAGLRGAMIRKLQSLSITFHKEMESGRIQSKVMRDVENITNFTNSIFDTGFNVLFNLSITLAVVITKNITVFFMFLVCVPFSILLRNIFSKRLKRQSRAFRKEIEHTSADVLDMEELIPVTRAHALENKEIKKMTANVKYIAESGYRLDFVSSIFGSIHWVTVFLFQAICLVFTGYLALHGRISIGEISLYQTYFTTLTGYVSSLIGLLPTIAVGTESIHSVGEILAAYDTEDNTNKKKITKLDGRYEFRNVSFNYDERTAVLHDFNLTVEPGETIALVGESGSGKSTVMNMVIGFYKAGSGQVLVDGNDITELDLHEYRKMLSVVPQNSILFSGTIRDNITYGRRNISESELQSVIRAAQLESVIESLPDGLDTLVGEHGSKLSGGQRQRISIARAIIRNPRVIIFDEATSALDSVTEREIQAAIDSLTADRTTFIVAHRLSTIKNADKIAVLRDGHCVEYGTYDELIAKKGEFYRYKEMQS